MAIWQFDIVLVPEAVPAQAAIDTIVVGAVDDREATTTWWPAVEALRDASEKISKVLEGTTTWHESLLCWGSKENVLIEIWTDAGRISQISARVDLREVKKSDLARLVKLTQSLGCRLFLWEEKVMAAPDVEVLIAHIRKSRAYLFCVDPDAYFEKIKKIPFPDEP